jgi:hypothetical protein
MQVDSMLSGRKTVVELPWAADSCPCVVEAANRVTSNCWYQRRRGAVGVHLKARVYHVDSCGIRGCSGARRTDAAAWVPPSAASSPRANKASITRAESKRAAGRIPLSSLAPPLTNSSVFVYMRATNRSRRTCTRECGLQSCRGKSAGVTKRPCERSPTRNP